jgi:aminopeptidase
VVFTLPTPQEAAMDEVDYGDFVRAVFQACDRDWPKVKETQDTLIDILRNGKKLTIMAGEDRWRTHLEMDISGMIFANQTTELNFPGSEVFSAPVRYSTQGTYTIPYKLRFAGNTLPNLGLVFEKGRVVDAFTDGDRNWVQSTLDTDKGSREIGEIAFGTNGALTRPTLNSMYVEKTTGVHIALGNAYEFDTFAGKPVRVDNGVRSYHHIDLARVMSPDYPGRVLLDGVEIQRNGFFRDPRLQILNPLQ